MDKENYVHVFILKKSSTSFLLISGGGKNIEVDKRFKSMRGED